MEWRLTPMYDIKTLIRAYNAAAAEALRTCSPSTLHSRTHYRFVPRVYRELERLSPGDASRFTA